MQMQYMYCLPQQKIVTANKWKEIELTLGQDNVLGLRYDQADALVMGQVIRQTENTTWDNVPVLFKVCWTDKDVYSEEDEDLAWDLVVNAITSSLIGTEPRANFERRLSADNAKVNCGSMRLQQLINSQTKINEFNIVLEFSSGAIMWMV